MSKTILQLCSSVAPLRGEITVPGDKSVSHRAVMFGSIAEGVTTVENFLTGDDCLSTIDCFRKLGVTIEVDDTNVFIYGKGVRGLKEPKDILDVGNSGTTIRLMLGILAGGEGNFVFTGDDSIAKRPMKRVAVPLREMGANIDGREGGQYTPLVVRGKELHGITYEMPVSSAQLKSAILLAGLQAEGVTTVVEKEKSRDHTERMLRMFDVDVEVDGLTVSVKGKQKLQGTHVVVPGDISSAAFFLCAGAMKEGSRIILRNVGLNETRTGIIDVLQSMGAALQIERVEEAGEPYGNLIIESSELHGTIIEGSLIPRLIDEIPIIALLATQANGTTVIRDAQELKVKESNRIETVVRELRKLGANIEATDDGMVIHGRTKLQGAVVNSYHDHRIGMMLAVASLIAEGETLIENGDCISVSYPQFFKHLRTLQQS